MKKVLIFVALCLGLTDGTYGAVRDGGVATRAKNGTTNTTQRLTNSTKSARTAARTSTLTPRGVATTTKSATTRATTARATVNNAARTTSARATTQNQSPIPRVIARATTDTDTQTPQTRTGAEYERCKTAYFTCMDQFCGQKNDDYRRCSCSNRLYDLVDARETLTQAGEQLTVFTENLDVVGMTAAQATAMKTASDGEKALADDKSASKALLQAILNSIRGKDSSVGGKFSDLNSINISFDTANAFGTMDAGQAIATYNGQNLYSAVYPQCRAAVRADCNDASLQRAITAYLMAIEQDCNTVETAVENKRKEMKSAIREGSAMLDLARVENRQKHNSSDITTCIAEVESAILSEQVCGAGYHKCLDNGEFIDISTGAPIAGVTNFYQLADMLKFADGVDAANQKLSKNTANRTFVQNFESRTKKFAADALDKCVEDADIVWSEYLDRALLDIYYAQRAKVAIIKQGCFDFVSTCYMNADGSMTDAMKELTGDSGLTIQPSKITLTGAMCTDYVNSCNSLFKTDIIKDYITERQETDTLTACRAVAKQCFDSFGGANYENFYYPYSGLFTPNTGTAPDWFTLYEYISDDTYSKKSNINDTTNYDPTYTEFVEHNGKYRRYKSTCAKQLTAIDSCNSPEMIEAAFGGFDKMYVESPSDDTATTFNTSGNGTCDYIFTGEKTDGSTEKYGIMDGNCLSHRIVRPTGVATEIYNQVIDILTTQCTNLQGRFMELQYGRLNQYMPDNICMSNFTFPTDSDEENQIKKLLVLGDGNKDQHENMCPRDYTLSVDTKSWGACLCWENGGRRSKNGTSAKCVAAIPVAANANDATCSNELLDKLGWHFTEENAFKTLVSDPTAWCVRNVYSSKKQICPVAYDDGDEITSSGECDYVVGGQSDLPDGLSM